MIQKDLLSEVQDIITRMKNREGMSQYLLLIDAEDVVFSKDLMIIKLLNNSYHGLDVFLFNQVINEALELLLEGTSRQVIDIVIEDGCIAFKPLIVNEFDTTNEFFLFSKLKPGFILKPIYDKYFNDIDDIKLTHDMFINQNASGLLSSDCNFVVYDDSDKLSRLVLKQYSRIFHSHKLIPRSKIIDFIISEVIDTETFVDFITSDLSSVMDATFIKLVEELNKLVESGVITLGTAKKNLKTYSVICSTTMYNIERLNRIDPNKKPGYNIGLTPIFSKRV
ncbi:MAG: hypothetical protein ACRCX8_16680 [Sarcina sp.]